MQLGKVFRQGIGLKNSESYILELFLLVYPLILIGGGASLQPYYVLIALALIMGLTTYFLFSVVPYSVIIGLVLSVFIAIPFYLIGLQIAPVIFLFCYIAWRTHANFSSERLNRMPFVLINTVVFACFYLFTRTFFFKTHAIEVNTIHATLFIVTTILFVLIRFLTTWVSGRKMPGFRLSELSKIFGSMFGVGVVVLLSVYYFIDTIRTAIISIFSFLFGGLFLLIAKAVTPLLDLFNEWILRNQSSDKEEVEMGEPDEAIQEGQVISDFDLNTYFIIFAILIAIGVIIYILKSRKLAIKNVAESKYSIRSGGKKQKPAVQLMYDYSKATNLVRTTYLDFEKEAIRVKSPRYAGETVKEWFARMSWESSYNLFDTYDKARYGSLSISNEDSERFVEELEEIKNKYFSNNV
ncbi:hypothetical protein [Sporosarcina sp. FA9]|uniref:hypothetical protein n=1 Tax=Sporosarcina sp. FA9 TaxID=3413030 RepID=UPI003F658DDB